jgi:hypothetical protein
MRKILWTIFSFWICGLLTAHADTFQLADGATLTGDIVTFNDRGVTFRLTDDSYTNIIWTKFSQDALKQLSQNPKINPLVTPFIEIPPSERPQKAEVKIQDVPRLDLPPKQSLFGALFSSSVGIIILLLIYAANLFAGFEIAVVRARPIPMVMGAAAILPILGPIIFLSMPVKMEAAPEEAQPEGETQTFVMPGAPPKDEIKIVAGSWQAQSPPAGASAAQTQVFQRGQFTFNRRFFETKFSTFFGAIRRGPEKDLTLLVKATSGQFAVERIARLGANEIYFEVAQGDARQEIMVPFADIQEIQLKPKSA